jgi:hypothetical protein
MAKSLVDMTALALLVKRPAGSLDEDAYSLFWVAAADDIVKTTAGHPEWVGAEPGPGEVVAPLRARNIATLLAKRAWLDQDNLQRRTSGPISDTFFESDLSALELTDAERNWLEAQSDDDDPDALWVLGIGSSQKSTPIYIPDGAPGADPVLMDDGTSAFAYGEE